MTSMAKTIVFPASTEFGTPSWKPEHLAASLHDAFTKHERDPHGLSYLYIIRSMGEFADRTLFETLLTRDELIKEMVHLGLLFEDAVFEHGFDTALTLTHNIVTADSVIDGSHHEIWAVCRSAAEVNTMHLPVDDL